MSGGKVDENATMILSKNDKREVCPLHGWVGRTRFQLDRHDLCEAPAEESSSDIEHEDESQEETPTEANHVEKTEAERPKCDRQATRRRRIPPKKTVAVRRITQLELQAGRAELLILGANEPYERPKTRGDCASVPRPCPYVGCSKNLYLDVSKTGSIILNFPHLEPGEMPAEQSCALDLAERGGMTLEEIAGVTNLTRERIRQVELKALSRRARPAALALGLGAEDAAAIGTRRHVGPGADLAETGVDGEEPSDVATILASDNEPNSR
jgi:hypothetical protein